MNKMLTDNQYRVVSTSYSSDPLMRHRDVYLYEVLSYIYTTQSMYAKGTVDLTRGGCIFVHLLPFVCLSKMGESGVMREFASGRELERETYGTECGWEFQSDVEQFRVVE